MGVALPLDEKKTNSVFQKDTFRLDQSSELTTITNKIQIQDRLQNYMIIPHEIEH